jgi:hypothetical protein
MNKEKKEAVWVDVSTHKKLKILSAIKNETISETGVKAMNEYIEKNKDLIDSFFKD